MWTIFGFLLPKKQFETNLNNIEKYVRNKEWEEAKLSVEELSRIYKENEIIIQINNATEVLTSFQSVLGQLYISVEHKQDSAIEYIGALRATLDLVMQPFSGP